MLQTVSNGAIIGAYLHSKAVLQGLADPLLDLALLWFVANIINCPFYLLLLFHLFLVDNPARCFQAHPIAGIAISAFHRLFFRLP